MRTNSYGDRSAEVSNLNSEKFSRFDASEWVPLLGLSKLYFSMCSLLAATYLQTILPLELKVSAYFYLFEPIDMTRCPFLECVY
jgi:hypothetical protein